MNHGSYAPAHWWLVVVNRRFFGPIRMRQLHVMQ